MKTSQLIYLLLFLFTWTVTCFPSKPLNERSTELTWQAWLLIDESQNKQQDSTLRRRITPKSVFIAPTFSPENLPECSEGYQSDSMGRCIKIIMLNKEMHLDFLLQQLNQKFGGIEDYEDEEGSTTGPLNINIPLNADVQEETDIAIVVAPTNSILQNTSDMQMQINKTLSEEMVNVGDIAGILGLKQAAEVETSTITGTQTLSSDSTTQESTTKNFETTTSNEGAVTSEFNALFFLDPKRQVEVETSHEDDSTTILSTLDADTTATDIMKTTTEIKRETLKLTSDSNTNVPLYQMDQALPHSEQLIPFADIKREAIKSTKFTPDLPLTTDSVPTSFTFKTTTFMPETKLNDIHHQESVNGSPSMPIKKDPELQTTMAPIVFAPIDNRLTNQDIPSTTSIPISPTGSIFSSGFHKPNFENLYNKMNMKFFPRFGEPSSSTTKQTTSENFEQLVTTTEVITSTLIQEEFPTSTRFMSSTETEIPTTNNPGIPVSSEKVNKQHEQVLVKIPAQTSQLVRFPSSLVSAAPAQGELTSYASKHQETVFPATASHVDLSESLYQRYKAHRENHRNRDKHSEWFHLPPKWSDTSQKPVVLRFSRKHGYIDTQQLGSNNFYREINPRLFGFPAKSRIHR